MRTPRFRAYLRQKLVDEHHRLRTQKAVTTWRAVACAALAACVAGTVWPRLPWEIHRRMVAPWMGGTHVVASLPGAGGLGGALERDRDLLRGLGLGHGVRLVPAGTYVVNQFYTPGGREVSVFTPLWRGEEAEDPAELWEGGVW